MNQRADAQILDCGERFRLDVGGWSGQYPVADLARWAAFYRRLRDRREGRYARFYAPTVEALEALRRQIKAAG